MHIFHKIGLALALLGLLPACGSKDVIQEDTVLVFGRGEDSVGLDPGHEDDGESFNVSCNIYDNLVAFQPGSIQIEAALAEKWTTSADGKEYTFHLRRGVKFHDGTPFNADAVIFSLMRQHDPKHPFHNVGGPWKYWTNTGMDQLIESIEKQDDFKVVIRLKKPYAPFMSNLAMDFCAIVSPTAVEKHKDQFNFNPVGTGPYMLESWQRGQKITLKANKDYWGTKPSIGRIIFVAIKDNSVRYQTYKQNQLDGFNYPNPFELQEIQKTPKTNFMTQSGLNVSYIAMNTKKPPFDDVRVRQAINLAINKKAIVSNFYQGLGAEAKSPIPPLMGWSHNFDLKDYGYDPAKAKKLLAEVRKDKTKAKLLDAEHSLWAMDNPRPYLLAPDKVAAAVIADLEAVGLKVKKVTYDWSTYLDKTERGEHEMALMGWISDNGDPDNFLYTLLSKDVLPAGDDQPTNNISFWSNDKFSDLVRKAREVTKQEERGKLYKEAQQIFMDEAPWVPLAHSVQVFVMRDYIKGFVIHPTTKTEFRNVKIVKP